MELNVLSRIPDEVTAPAPVLFVHGAWHGAWCWDRHFLPFFAARGWEAHAVDLRGHGDSPGRDELKSASVSDYVDDVAEAVDSLEKAPVLVGHSMGGLVVQRYLETHTVPAAVLMAAVPPRGAWRATLRTAWRHPMAFAKVNLTRNLGPIVQTKELAKDVLFSPATDDATVDEIHPQRPTTRRSTRSIPSSRTSRTRPT